jgi:hypothetical protein
MGAVTDGKRKPTKRKSPAAMMADEPGLMIIALVHPKRNPHVGPVPRLTYI